MKPRCNKIIVVEGKYDKIKLDSIDDNATKIVVDEAMSSTSTNPVQNKVINNAIHDLSVLVGDTAVSTQISNAVKDKADVNHAHDDQYYTESEVDAKLTAKADTDHTHEISELIDLSNATVSHASTSDTANAVAWENVTGKPGSYTPAIHSHAIADVSNLQETLDAKVPTSRTVNGRALSENITLSASDVGADASGSADAALTNAQNYTDAEIAAWVGDKTVSVQIDAAIASKADSDHTHTALEIGADFRKIFKKNFHFL